MKLISLAEAGRHATSLLVDQMLHWQAHSHLLRAGGAEVKAPESDRAVGRDVVNGAEVKEGSKEELVVEDEGTMGTTLNSRLDRQAALEDSTEVMMLIYDTLAVQNFRFKER